MRELAECQSVAQHLRAQHNRIRRAVSAIEHAFQPAAGDDAAITGNLAVLYDELSQQLAAEDDGGGLEEAVCRCPRLAEQATRLSRQHRQLLARLQRIIDGRRELPPDTGITRERFRRFSATLARHQAAESRILATAFGGNFSEDML
jgi:septal ring factor EnvC (AmiA/AmiB activator)